MRCHVVPRGAAWCRGAAVRWRRGAVWCPVMPSWTVGTTNPYSHQRRQPPGPPAARPAAWRPGPRLRELKERVSPWRMIGHERGHRDGWDAGYGKSLTASGRRIPTRGICPPEFHDHERSACHSAENSSPETMSSRSRRCCWGHLHAKSGISGFHTRRLGLRFGPRRTYTGQNPGRSSCSASILDLIKCD